MDSTQEGEEAYMGTLPPPVEKGQALLAIFKLHRARPGSRLGFAALYGAFVAHEIGTKTEFDQGIEWLKQQGYVTPYSGMKTGYTLTDFGFATLPGLPQKAAACAHKKEAAR
jgi:hypothetical protein